MRKLCYDPACAELARHFLDGEHGSDDPDTIADLAQDIQDAVESWFDCREAPTPQSSGEKA
jgi:hypothetical protein